MKETMQISPVTAIASVSHNAMCVKYVNTAQAADSKRSEVAPPPPVMAPIAS